MFSPTLLATLVLVLATAAGCGGCERDPPNVAHFIQKATAGNSSMAIAVGCTAFPQDSCTTAADQAVCTQAVGCGSDNQCIFARSTAPGCPCFEGEVRWCDATTVQFCARTSATTADWQKTCGPTAQTCSTGIPDCDAGTRRGTYDVGEQRWEFDADNGQPCVPVARCPASGEKRWCDTGDRSCAGQQTYSTTTGWSTCERLCPPPVPTICGPGGARDCQTSEGCPGQQFCSDDGMSWGSCTGRMRCPGGWPFENGLCTWHSPSEGSGFSYYPHRASNDTVAATGTIGYPSPAGQPGPIYVAVTLAQWSTPAAPDGGNYCGKDNHVGAWVGCIHPNNTRGYGRDVFDHEWVSGATTIELRCDPGDTVGAYKYSWGHVLSWHCTRRISINVARNHDAVATCVY